MFPVVTPWTPGFQRLAVGLGRVGLGQAVPSVAPSPGVPSAPSAPSGGGGSAALGIAAGVIALGLGAVGVLFSYGVAAESKSGMVKTTGYILAGTGALMALINAGVVFVAATK